MNLKLARQRVATLEAEIAQAKKDRAAIGDAALQAGQKMSDEDKAKFLAAGKLIADKEDELTEAKLLRDATEAANEADRSAAPVVDPDVQANLTAMKRAGITVPQIQVEDVTKKQGYFGRCLQAVHAFAAKGGWNYITASEADLLKSMQAAYTGSNSDVASDGGFLVAQERSSAVLQRAYSQGQILSRVSRMPIGAGSDGLKLPAIDETSRANNSRFGGIVSGWLGQGGTLTSGKPKFREMDLKLRKVGAFVYATDELLKDAVAFEAWVNRYLPLELTFRAEDAILNGVGGTQPQGILNSGAVISVTRATASRVQYEDVRSMWARMWAPARTNAVWLIDQSVEAELEIMSLAIGTAGVLAAPFKPAGSVPGQTLPTLYGRPVITTEYGANLGTAGDIILADLSEYTLIDKGGVDQAVSMHVAFLTDESVFRFIYRVDGQLNWNSALTPKSAGSTQSVVIALAA